METVLLHKSASLCVTPIFRLSSFGSANALLTGITKTFLPFSSSFPEIFCKERTVSSRHKYLDEKIFHEKLRHVIEFREKNKLDENLIHQSKKIGKYIQYIGVPIACPNQKILGLIQFIVKSDERHENKLSDDEFDVIKNI